MNKKNTFKQGDLFESKTYELLKVLLENDDFYVSGKKSKIFRKKEYYSQKRKSNIIFDITIETYLDNSNDYSLLTIIECKNYDTFIPVSDIEEFDSKIRQISEHNTKGILIANNAFQKGAYNFALSTGIGLVRVNNNDEFEWIVRRKVGADFFTNHESQIAKFESKNLDNGINFISILGKNHFTNIADFLVCLEIIDFFKHKEKFINIPYVTEDKIDEIVSKIEKYDVYSSKMLDENKICKFLETKYQVKFEPESDLESSMLGKIEFDPLIIKLNKNLNNDKKRFRFTLSHEIGHLILHSNLLKDKISEKFDTDFSLSYTYSISEMTVRRIEIQANVFASHLLLPKNSLLELVHNYFNEENIHKGFLYWDHQVMNQNLVLILLKQISEIYQVSIEVARIRLIALGLLKDERFKNIKDILKELNLR